VDDDCFLGKPIWGPHSLKDDVGEAVEVSLCKFGNNTIYEKKINQMVSLFLTEHELTWKGRKLFTCNGGGSSLQYGHEL